MITRNSYLLIGLLAIAASACKESQVAPGYCSHDCAQKWEPECLKYCGIAAPKDSGAGRGGTAGSSGGSGGAASKDDGGAAGLSSGMDAAAGAGGQAGATEAGGSSGSFDAGPCGHPCGTTKPLCDVTSAQCVQCLGNDDCSGSTPACETTTHVCVECLAPADCGGNRPLCDTTSHHCVQCAGTSDCSGDTPVCDPSDHSCVQCAANGDCQSGNSVCNPATRSCVECLANDDCKDIGKARCDVADHTCKGCTADMQCTHLTATPVCDEEKSVCVECTADTEAMRCGDKACKRSTGTCTATTRGTIIPCNLCEADSECETGTKCVVLHFGNTDLGPYCFYDRVQKGSCADANHLELSPFSQAAMNVTSIDGVTSTYCLPPSTTTCQGFRDAAMQTGCLNMSSNMPDDTLCGEPGLDDGHCGTSGTIQGKCTYSCLDRESMQPSSDCPTSGFTTCPTSGGAYCQ